MTQGPEQSPEQAELARSEQTFLDALAVLPLSEPAKRSLLAAASSWAKAASIAAETH